MSEQEKVIPDAEKAAEESNYPAQPVEPAVTPEGEPEEEAPAAAEGELPEAIADGDQSSLIEEGYALLMVRLVTGETAVGQFSLADGPAVKCPPGYRLFHKVFTYLEGPDQRGQLAVRMIPWPQESGMMLSSAAIALSAATKTQSGVDVERIYLQGISGIQLPTTAQTRAANKSKDDVVAALNNLAKKK